MMEEDDDEYNNLDYFDAFLYHLQKDSPELYSKDFESLLKQYVVNKAYKVTVSWEELAERRTKQIEVTFGGILHDLMQELKHLNQKIDCANALSRWVNVKDKVSICKSYLEIQNTPESIESLKSLNEISSQIVKELSEQIKF